MNSVEPPLDVLIVDDTNSILILLEGILKQAGYIVRISQSGSDALEQAGENTPDIVLLDVTMPVMDGYQVCSAMKAIPTLRDVPIIFISALEDPKNRVKGFAVGGIDYLTKPFHSDEVIARVDAHANHYRFKRELQAKNNALAVALDELRETQSQLIQSEKMASIGQLAAGVAHEINNPIGYVSSNLHSLKGYVDDLFKIVDSVTSASDAANQNDRFFDDIAQLLSDLDIDYLRQDLTELVQESEDGLKRVKTIVQDLKDFSRVDKGEWEDFDIHDGINSTINVIWNELKYKAKVVKEYGTLPLIRCIPSQLNQVFMNLLINASQAIEKSGSITIRTVVKAEEVWISVSDTGKGIDKDHLSKIFDPFFTTKPVGKGTGLGLSLSYGIIEKHDGRIEVQSEIGKGTKFDVILPIAGKHSEEVNLE